MKKLIFKTMLLSGALFASCSDNVLEAPVQEEYAKSFVDIFGPVHPEQDWNMAEQKSVTVNVSQTTDVKIFASEGESYRLVGSFNDVSGKQTFKFDALENVNDFRVMAQGKVINIKNGETADFNAVSRNYNDNVNGIFTQLTDYKIFEGKQISQYWQRLTEKDDHTNDVGLKKDFFATVGDENYLQNQTVTVYPIYWNAGYNHVLGIYTYNADGSKNMTPIYHSKKGDDLQVLQSDETYKTTTATQAYDPKTVRAIRSKGFTIDLPTNTPFGFYIDVYQSGSTTKLFTWYSEKAYNEDGYVHAAYFQEKVDNKIITYLGFEDMHFTNGSKNKGLGYVSDKDLNDIMFILDPAPVIYDNSSDTWIIAAEDLGVTDDYDFNDLVVEVSHMPNSGEVWLTPLAAGGVYPIYITHNGEKISNVAGATEFHEQLKAGVTKSNGVYPMLNTSVAGPKGESFKIEVTEPWSLQSFMTQVPMGGLSISVEHGSGATTIAPPGTGDAPQMICIPASWMWPKERTRIDNAYPNFSTWSSDNDPSTSYDNTEADQWGNLYYNGQYWFTNSVEGTTLTNSNE